jgi:hypothetical protein
MNSNPATERFAISVRDYCHWAEGAGSGHAEEAYKARLHLARLFAQALELPDVADWDGNGVAIPDEDWRQIFSRFGVLPFNYYGTCLGPFDLGASETGIGDLADDLAET